jgi:hypothetical protein
MTSFLKLPCAVRRFALIACLVFTGSVAKSQILVGPVAGTQITWVSFDEKGTRKSVPTIGYHAGGSIAFRVQKRFFLQTSILYSQKKKHIEDSDDRDLYNKTTWKYLDIPILYTAEFKARLKGGREFKWYLGAGPTISYLLGGKGTLKTSELLELGINPPSYTWSYKVSFKDDDNDAKRGYMNIENANRLQLGLNVSTGVIFEPMGLYKFMFTLRYEVGSSFMSRTSKGSFPMGDGTGFSYQDYLRVRNNSLTASLYYFVDLKTDQRKRGKSTSKIKTNRRKR